MVDSDKLLRDLRQVQEDMTRVKRRSSTTMTAVRQLSEVAEALEHPPDPTKKPTPSG